MPKFLVRNSDSIIIFGKRKQVLSALLKEHGFKPVSFLMFVFGKRDKPTPIYIRHGVGADQHRHIVAYDKTTKNATVDRDFGQYEPSFIDPEGNALNGNIQKD